MGTITVRKEVHAPVDRVFDVFSDLDRAEERITGTVKLEKLTGGPVGVGTRFRETRVMFKREATEEMEFVGFEPGQSYTVACDSCGCHYETTYSFNADGNGNTQVECAFGNTPVTFMARLMSPLGKMMSGSLKKCLEKDMDELKAVAEAT